MLAPCRPVALLLALLLTACARTDHPAGGAPPEAVKTVYLAVVGACAAGNADALWALMTPRLQGELEATARTVAGLDASTVKAFYGRESVGEHRGGKAFLEASMGAGASGGELCREAAAWQVLGSEYVGEDGYAYAVGRSDRIVHGLQLTRAGGRWKLDRIVKGVRDRPPPSEPVAAAAPPPPEPRAPTAPQTPQLTRGQRIQRWVAAKLKGHDNNMAAFRVADIDKRGSGHSIYIKNQFEFTCGLKFDAYGNPNMMTGCKGGAGWRATPARIKLSCKTDDRGRELCRGRYRLHSGSGYASSATFQFFRRLTKAEREALAAIAAEAESADAGAAPAAAASTAPPKPKTPGHPLLGAWKCTFRSGKYTYAPMRCRITRRGGGYYIEKLQGSQRIRGTLSDKGDTLVFKGRYHCPHGDCDGPAHGTFRKQGKTWVAQVHHTDPRGHKFETGVTLRR